MSPTRREFMKDAALAGVGIPVLGGTAPRAGRGVGRTTST